MSTALKPENRYGNWSRELVEDVVSHSKRVKPFQKIKSQKTLAYALFQADDEEWPAGHSKIDNALKRKCSAPTYIALLERAIELNLLPPRGPAENDADFYAPHFQAVMDMAKRGRR